MTPFNTLVIVETLVAFVVAITLHELAHAGMANILGDDSPPILRRLSIDPRRQLAAVGTIVAVTLSFGIPLGFTPVGLGWGKPVEVDTRHVRVSPDTGVFLVALAGPLFSFAMGLLFAVPLRLMPGSRALTLFTTRCYGSSGALLQTCLSQAQPIWLLRTEQLLYILAVTNILIALLNLIPLHPLDGYGMLFALLPNGPAVRYRDFRPYMELILLVVFFVVPYLFQFIGLSVINPGYWLSTLSQIITGGLSGSAYPLFVYTL